MNVILTERLIIRRPQESDLKDFLAYRNDAENLRFQPIVPTTEVAALKLFKSQSFLNEETATGWVMFVMELKDENKMIGEVGIYISSDGVSNGDLGWSVHQDYQRKGYALEAAEVLLSYAFTRRKLQKVTATCVSTNTASILLMERLGMHRGVDYIQNQFIDEVSYDEYLYTLSSKEWFARE